MTHWSIWSRDCPRWSVCGICCRVGHSDAVTNSLVNTQCKWHKGMRGGCKEVQAEHGLVAGGLRWGVRGQQKGQKRKVENTVITHPGLDFSGPLAAGGRDQLGFVAPSRVIQWWSAPSIMDAHSAISTQNPEEEKEILPRILSLSLSSPRSCLEKSQSGKKGQSEKWSWKEICCVLRHAGKWSFSHTWGEGDSVAAALVQLYKLCAAKQIKLFHPSKPRGQGVTCCRESSQPPNRRRRVHVFFSKWKRRWRLNWPWLIMVSWVLDIELPPCFNRNRCQRTVTLSLTEKLSFIR